MALPIRLKSAPPTSRPAPIMLDQSAALERHYAPSEIAQAWGISTDTVRELFRAEPGVIDLSAGRNSSRRRYSRSGGHGCTSGFLGKLSREDTEPIWEDRRRARGCRLSGNSSRRD